MNFISKFLFDLLWISSSTLAFYAIPNHESLKHLNRAPLSWMVRVWIEQAEDGFVDSDENLMEGEICLRAVKAFASSSSCDEEVRFLGAGALVQRPKSQQYHIDNESRENDCVTICDAWIADSLLDEPNTQIHGAQLILDDLFEHHLLHIRNVIFPDKNEDENHRTHYGYLNDMDDDKWLENVVSSFVVQNGDKGMDCEYHCASYMAAISRGFVPLSDCLSKCSADDINSNISTNRVGLLNMDDEYNTNALIFDSYSYNNLSEITHDDNEKNGNHSYRYQYTVNSKQGSLTIAVKPNAAVGNILEAMLDSRKQSIKSITKIKK